MAYEALDVLHDRTRRRVLELIGTGERSVGELADQLPVSQPAVSQHLKVLREAGLVQVRASGTRRLYRVDHRGLESIRAWVDSFWDDVLDSFASHIESRTDPEGTP